MKKIVIIAALFLGSMTAFAQTENGDKEGNKEVSTQSVPEKFVEISQQELPEAVLSALSSTYPEASLEKVFVNEKKEYKIEVNLNGQKATVYTDANGNWITR